MVRGVPAHLEGQYYDMGGSPQVGATRLLAVLLANDQLRSLTLLMRDAFVTNHFQHLAGLKLPES
jgi:hypothetical protein